METTTTELKRCVVVEVSGRVDSVTAPELDAVLKDLHAKGHYNLVLNMSDVDFISSAGLRVLIDAQKTSKRLNRGKLVLTEVPQPIYEAFDLAGFVALFDFHDEQFEAVGSF